VLPVFQILIDLKRFFEKKTDRLDWIGSPLNRESSDKWSKNWKRNNACFLQPRNNKINPSEEVVVEVEDGCSGIKSEK